MKVSWLREAFALLLCAEEDSTTSSSPVTWARRAGAVAPNLATKALGALFVEVESNVEDQCCVEDEDVQVADVDEEADKNETE